VPDRWLSADGLNRRPSDLVGCPRSPVLGLGQIRPRTRNERTEALSFTDAIRLDHGRQGRLPLACAHRPARDCGGFISFADRPERDTTHPECSPLIPAPSGGEPNAEHGHEQFLAYVWVTGKTWTPYG